jgi:hypothetical protein
MSMFRLPKFMLKFRPTPPIPQNVTVFGDRVFKEVIGVGFYPSRAYPYRASILLRNGFLIKRDSHKQAQM